MTIQKQINKIKEEIETILNDKFDVNEILITYGNETWEVEVDYNYYIETPSGDNDIPKNTKKIIGSSDEIDTLIEDVKNELEKIPNERFK